MLHRQDLYFLKTQIWHMDIKEVSLIDRTIPITKKLGKLFKYLINADPINPFAPVTKIFIFLKTVIFLKGILIVA